MKVLDGELRQLGPRERSMGFLAWLYPGDDILNSPSKIFQRFSLGALIHGMHLFSVWFCYLRGECFSKPLTWCK